MAVVAALSRKCSMPIPPLGDLRDGLSAGAARNRPGSEPGRPVGAERDRVTVKFGVTVRVSDPGLHTAVSARGLPGRLFTGPSGGSCAQIRSGGSDMLPALRERILQAKIVDL